MSITRNTTDASGPTHEANGSHALRNLPSVDKLLAHPAIVEVLAILPHDQVVSAVRGELEAIRSAARLKGGTVPSLEEIAHKASQRARAILDPSLKPIINATGVIIQTNLGRAPLCASAVEALAAMSGYSNLEYSLEEGRRGSRYSHAGGILRQVTGCEDALVVNNTAAALVLVLGALASGKEVILARGQLVEIGGGFRIPDVMRQSGARLVEVGTTNRTYVRDYANAITPDTALIMRVHASNFRITGFATEPTVGELAALAGEQGLTLVDDVGSGALLDTQKYGLLQEPMVQTGIEAGADLVLFSGDKLVGGPQCGIIAGRRAAVEKLKHHPLARALRVDKLTLAALEATLAHYLKGDYEREVPVWRMISTPESALLARAARWAAHLREANVRCEVTDGASAVGGGSLPGETLPTHLVKVMPEGEGPEQDSGALASRLRGGSTPVVARVEAGALLLDPRTVPDSDEDALLAAVISAYLAGPTQGT